MNAPNMITSSINSTKAKAAPDIPLFPQPVLHPHPGFIKHSSFFIFTMYFTQKNKFCE